MKKYYFLLGVTIALTSFSAIAADSDKSQYNLFNPTPRDQMRPFSTDQTTATLTPYTVDAGHVQIEANIFDYIYDKEDTYIDEGWILGYSTIKLGLCNQADLQVTFNSPHMDIRETDRATGAKSRFSGFGDTVIASKINLWGNDGGTTALALYPFINIPTGSGSDYYGGFRIIFAAQLPYKLQLGLKTGLNLYENGSDDLHATFRNSVSLQRELLNKLSGYIEFATTLNEEDSSWTGFGNLGFAFQATRDFQIHAGIYMDVENSQNYNPYLGFSWRL